MMKTWKSYLSIDFQILTLCLCPLGTILMQNVFNFYYVKIFLENYRLERGWFNLGQVCFTIWNALGEPIFGCWQNAKNDDQKRWWHQRRKVILYVGPFYALSFLTPWFTWRTTTGVDRAAWIVGAHFLTSLFIYDTLFSFIVIGWCSLFIETITEHEKRIRAVKYVQVANIIGANSLPVFEKISDSLTNMTAFRICAVVVALIAVVCFFITGKFTKDGKLSSIEVPDDTIGNSNIRISLQILKDRDFLAFVFMNFLTVVRTTIHANFTAVFTERLIPQKIFPKGSWMISTFYGILSTLPQILVFVWSPVANRCGTYKIFKISFACSAIFAAIMGIIGSSYPISIIIFMIIDAPDLLFYRICIDSIAPLIPILNADVIDSDFEKHKRKFKASSIFFGLNAMITKPAVSLAPLFIVFVLNQFNYDRLNSAENYHTVAIINTSSIVSNFTVTAAIDDDIVHYWQNDVKKTMFFLLWAIPLVVGSVQLLVFWKYSLINTHIHDGKRGDEQL
uniref:Uncharacterized protein n=1 Tax=Romanomermis culicivorax TaxID=13658 RepID=A0A915JRY2_ROMCU